MPVYRTLDRKAERTAAAASQQEPQQRPAEPQSAPVPPEPVSAPQSAVDPSQDWEAMRSVQEKHARRERTTMDRRSEALEVDW